MGEKIGTGILTALSGGSEAAMKMLEALLNILKTNSKKFKWIPNADKHLVSLLGWLDDFLKAMFWQVGGDKGLRNMFNRAPFNAYSRCVKRDGPCNQQLHQAWHWKASKLISDRFITAIYDDIPKDLEPADKVPLPTQNGPFLNFWNAFNGMDTLLESTLGKALRKMVSGQWHRQSLIRPHASDPLCASSYALLPLWLLSDLSPLPLAFSRGLILAVDSHSGFGDSDYDKRQD